MWAWIINLRANYTKRCTRALYYIQWYARRPQALALGSPHPLCFIRVIVLYTRNVRQRPGRLWSITVSASHVHWTRHQYPHMIKATQTLGIGQARQRRPADHMHMVPGSRAPPTFKRTFRVYKVITRIKQSGWGEAGSHSIRVSNLRLIARVSKLATKLRQTVWGDIVTAVRRVNQQTRSVWRCRSQLVVKLLSAPTVDGLLTNLLSAIV